MPVKKKKADKKVKDYLERAEGIVRKYSNPEVRGTYAELYSAIIETAKIIQKEELNASKK